MNVPHDNLYKNFTNGSPPPRNIIINFLKAFLRHPVKDILMSFFIVLSCLYEIVSGINKILLILTFQDIILSVKD